MISSAGGALGTTEVEVVVSVTSTVDVELGTSTVDVELGTSTVDVELGTSTVDVELGTSTVDVELGTSTVDVELGTSTVDVELGTSTVDVELGTSTVDDEVGEASETTTGSGIVLADSSPGDGEESEDSVTAFLNFMSFDSSLLQATSTSGRRIVSILFVGFVLMN